MSAAGAVGKLLRPRSIAVVGASSDPSKTAGRPVAYLLRHRYGGNIYPVNPRLQDVGGLECWPDIASLPATPEVALVLLGAERAIEAVHELAARGTAAGPMRLLGPNTIGLVNLADGVMLTPSGALELEMLPIGNISMVSRSGGLLSSLLARAAARGVGFASLVCTGNEADLDAADFVDFLADDPGTAVIAQYMESLRRPALRGVAYRRHRRIGRDVRRAVPPGGGDPGVGLLRPARRADGVARRQAAGRHRHRTLRGHRHAPAAAARGRSRADGVETEGAGAAGGIPRRAGGRRRGAGARRRRHRDPGFWDDGG